MKNKFYILIIFILTSINISSQELFPGGVAEPILWKQTKLISSDNASLININKTGIAQSDLVESKAVYINYNPAVYIDNETSEIKLPDNLGAMTLFIVYQVKDTLKEKNIWRIENDGKVEEILTTHRLYSKGKYINFLKGRQKAAEIHTYHQYSEESSETAKNLIIGGKAIKVPVENFKGIIPEIILYKRVLSANERLQVESYLAIKYGIPIYQGEENRNYLNSLSEIIWDAEKNKDFNKRIIGLGIDSKSGLKQLRSSSSLEPENFIIEFSDQHKELETRDKSFIIAGDNGKELKIKKTEQGQPLSVDRHWKITSTNLSEKFNIHIDSKIFEGEIPENNYYWLAIDKSGTGKYPEGSTEYKIIANKVKDYIGLKNIDLLNTQDKSAVFSIRLAPEMFSQVWIDQPSCNQTKKAGLSFKIEGGISPYKVELTKKDDNYKRNITILNTEEIYKIDNLSQGEYTYQVTDTKGNIYQEDLYVESYDSPKSDLKGEYTIIEKGNLKLDGKIKDEKKNENKYSYKWLDSKGMIISRESLVMIREQGTYKLEITNEQNCKSLKTIEVKEQSNNNFKNVDLFPNPSIGGEYFIRVELNRKSKVMMNIYDPLGRLLDTKELNGQDYYLYNGYQPNKGIYYIRLESEAANKTMKLLVK